MERRMPGNGRVRCEVGEKPEIISKAYLSLYSAPFVYYKEMVFVELPEMLTIDELELTKMKIKIKQTHISLQQFIKRNEWKRLFLFMDPRILAPAFDELFDTIPEEQRIEVLQAIQKRIGMYPVLRNKAALQMIARNKEQPRFY